MKRLELENKRKRKYCDNKMQQEKKKKQDMIDVDLPSIPNASTMLNKEELVKLKTYMNQSQEYMSKYFVSHSQ